MTDPLHLLDAIMKSSPDAIITHDLQGTVLSINSAAERMLGYPPSEAAGQPVQALLPEGGPCGVQDVTDAFQKGQTSCRLTDILDRTGRKIPVLLTTAPIINESATVGVLHIAQDLAREKTLELALHEKEEKFRSAFESAAIGMAIVSLEGRFSHVNTALSEIVGYGQDELLELTFHEITHPDDLDADLLLVRRLLAGHQRSYHLEKRYFHKSGRLVYVLLSVSILRKHDGQPLYFIAQIQDVSERKRTEEQLTEAKKEAERARGVAEKLAATDYLTGLLNRRAFSQRLDAELARSTRDSYTVSVIMADIDDFKKINDTYGHTAGDIVLREFAQALKASSRMYDFIGRHGGEEFVIALPGTPQEEGFLVAERMRSAVMKLSIAVEGSSALISVTASFGVATCTGGVEGGCSDLLIRAADSAMYAAKKSGKNRVCFTNQFAHCSESCDIPPPNCYRGAAVTQELPR